MYGTYTRFFFFLCVCVKSLRRKYFLCLHHLVAGNITKEVIFFPFCQYLFNKQKPLLQYILQCRTIGKRKIAGNIKFFISVCDYAKREWEVLRRKLRRYINATSGFWIRRLYYKQMNWFCDGKVCQFILSIHMHVYCKKTYWQK